MIDKVCLIYQPCGLGDILFMQKIAWKYYNEGYKIVWPVVSELSWLSEYIPWFDFVSWGDSKNKLTRPPLPESVKFDYKEYYHPEQPSIFSDNFLYLNFFNISDRPLIMKAKYDFANIEHDDYAKYIRFNENVSKQNELYTLLVKNNKYAFVNECFCLRPSVQKKELNFSQEYSVKLSIYEDYTLFDWIKILENSEKIVMVETSLNYLIEKLYLDNRLNNCKEFHLFHRNDDFSQVSYLFKVPWIYH